MADPEICAADRPSSERLLRIPRHLSQHVGGYRADRATAGSRSCRSAMRAMEDRTFIEWDKDDIDALGMMKVDVLALGHADLHPQEHSI